MGTFSLMRRDSGWPMPPAAPTTVILDTDCGRVLELMQYGNHNN